MKKIALFISLIIVTANFAQTNNPNYNEEKALEFGADQFGMKSYFFIVLKSGQNKTTDEAFIDSCFRGHLNNIRRLADEGKMVVAGPFGKNEDDFRGLFIVDVPTLEEAQALMQTDPAIHEGLLKAVYYPWYGSAALPAYLDTHDEIWQEKP